MFGSIGVPELLIIFAIVALIFGPKRLPSLGKSLGESIRAFRGAGEEATKGWDEKDAHDDHPDR